MFTSSGQRKRDNLVRVGTFEGLSEVLRPVINEIPGMVSQRVKGTGAGASGSFSTPYSRGWARERNKKGLQTSKKDFWFTGDMWGTFKLVEEKIDAGGIVFTLASDGSLGHNGEHLVDIHSKKEEQNILEITQEEFNEIDKKIMDAINKYFARWL